MARPPSEPWQTVLIGVGVALVGYLIRYRGWTFLIAGVAPFDPDDPAPGFVSYAGNLSLVVGGFVVALGAIQALGLLSLVPGWVQALALVAAVVGIVPRLGVTLPDD